MTYPLSAPLMELLLLSIIEEQDSYGYLIAQKLKRVSNMKDSALYPILRKMSDEKYVEIYDEQFQGRNRKYYRLTEQGNKKREELKEEWNLYSKEIDSIINWREYREKSVEGENIE